MSKSTTNRTKYLLHNPFENQIKEKVIPITQSQSEIWISCKMGGDNANKAYNTSISLELQGDLNIYVLETSIQKLVNRYDTLRSNFSTSGMEMNIYKSIDFSVKHLDFSSFSNDEKAQHISNYLNENVNHVFDLVKGPLFQVGLIKLGHQEYQLVFTAHHIICDDWSISVLLEELGQIYSGGILNKTLTLPKAEYFYSYADKQITYLKSEEYSKSKTFWKKEYAQAIPALNLPTDYPRPTLRTYNSKFLKAIIGANIVDKLNKIGTENNTDLVTILMAAFEVFLYQQTGQTDLVVGLFSAGQEFHQKPQTVGHCVNFLPLRSQISAETTFLEYLYYRKVGFAKALEHQEFSFGQLLQQLAIPRDSSRVPLVPVVFNMERENKILFEGLNIQLKNNPKAFDTFELSLNVLKSDGELVLEWSYNTALFAESSVKKMMVSFEEILVTITNSLEITIGEVIKSKDVAYQQLNNTSTAYPDVLLHNLIAKMAQNFPEKQALKFNGSGISYKDMEQQANQLAHYLVEQGVCSGDIVGVALPRSSELVILLLAIMQCGAAYLPLDPNYPEDRLEFMLEDSQSNLLIASKALHIKSNCKTLFVKDIFSNLSTYFKSPIDRNVNTDSMAYLLFTSGSTGKPKGVAVTNKNLVNFLHSMLQEPGINEADRLLTITTISFDIAALELFTPLLVGATLVIANDETARDSRLLLKLLKQENISILQATPSTWQMLLEVGWESPLPIKALCGGEAMPVSLSKKLLTRVESLWNMYGPTETTIWSTVKQIKSNDEQITIGRPIANTQVFILNEQGVLVDSGKTGEICIAGDGVALGYWKRPDLTSEKFITNTCDLNSNSKLYRTGDLGQLLPNGEILCLGRIDHQVKLRGHRIELGEIEQALDEEQGVQSSVVLVNENHLMAFVIPEKSGHMPKETIALWKENLYAKLPDYMVPQDYHVITEFPKTLNGKIDRKTLLANTMSKAVSTHFTAPRSKTEQIVTTIWKACLNREQIDICSNFFELGGHSLIAIKVMVSLEKETGKNLPLSSLLEYPTIEKLAEFVDSNTEIEQWNCLTPIKPEGNKDPLYVIHGADHNVLIFETLARNLDKEQPVYALQAKGLYANDEPHDSITAMAEHYISEIVQANPKGPYAIAGYSFGGIIAYEMARILKTQNRKVKTLIMLDSYVYPNYYFKNPIKKKMALCAYKAGNLLFFIRKMLSDRENFYRRIDIVKGCFNRVFLRFNLGNKEEQKGSRPWPEALDRKHKIAVDNHYMKPDDIEIDLLKVEVDDVFYAHDTKNLGWEPLAKGGINRHMIPGNHMNMFKHPNEKKLGYVLQAVLDGCNE
ncbi:amino acid adenylation domain-containing protein [Algibacter miyuki]|uniref:Amino acid adenylation domain-containing protein n=1 Tax=Algibacter miyuki TaxID=1306933 RepID=A0ABV5H115_9FLAO|nr:non-ribosomal peptide synthetase [Algibacter miyuki]MDN3667354.1 amino acid adenylation domain-containing protein [Algibacter miyuki]